MTNSADLDGFRQRCREFLMQHATDVPPSDRQDPRGDASLASARAFQGALFRCGLAGITYPAEYGGLGLSAEHEKVWREEVAAFPLQTGRLTISHGMCLPVLAEFGTDDQKRRYLGKLISAEEVWCQMFSEPGAGSDVASLNTRADRDGDGWILNGQKVWTTLAHLCERGIVLARTDPEQPKHRGISMFIVDMRSSGVEVRPIRQIDGRARFNEVFLTDVRVTSDDLIGEENDGWRLAMAMLMYERFSIGTGQQGGILTEWADELIEEARSRGRQKDPVLRQALVRLYSLEFCQSLLAAQTRARIQAGRAPGPAGSLGKLMRSRVARQVRDAAFVVEGPSSCAWDSRDREVDRWSKDTLSMLSASIAGGTDEVQKNIIGERVLGLPREPAVDRDIPFSKMARSPAASAGPGRQKVGPFDDKLDHR
jgi:alkylation response protein AidB-like acyl-CoA dehydrogenase